MIRIDLLTGRKKYTRLEVELELFYIDDILVFAKMDDEKFTDFKLGSAFDKIRTNYKWDECVRTEIHKLPCGDYMKWKVNPFLFENKSVSK